MKKTLAELRNSLRLTQRSLSKELNKAGEKHDLKFSPSSIALYELGLRSPTLAKAKIIANYFNVPLEEIIFGPSACGTKADFKPTGTGGGGE